MQLILHSIFKIRIDRVGDGNGRIPEVRELIYEAVSIKKLSCVDFDLTLFPRGQKGYSWWLRFFRAVEFAVSWAAPDSGRTPERI
jgi:hypothetical protein